MVELTAVIFDLDGVITDTAEYHYRAWQRLADEEGLPFNREINERLRGVSRRASLEIILAGRPMSEERIAEMMDRKNGYYVEMLKDVSPADLLPGAVPLLEELRAAGIKLAIGSASKNAQIVIDRLGIAHLFDAIADGFSVTRTKPAPDIFLKAAQLLGVRPALSAVVEDAGAGIEAAQAGGMWSIGVGPAERVGQADLRFPSLDGVTLAAIRQGLEDAAWTVTEPDFNPTGQHHTETVFTAGNGHFCLRGDFEEGYPGARPACFMYGLWDDMPINFTELANLPRWWGIDIWVNGERFRLNRGTLLNYRRSLDLRSGVLTRAVRWQPATGGPVIDLRFERFASLAQPDLAAMQVTLTVVTGSADIRVRTGLDTCGVENTGLLHWTLVDQRIAEDEVLMQVRTRATGCGLALATRLNVTATAGWAGAVNDADGQPALERWAQLNAGDSLDLEKFVALIGGPQVAETGERYTALLQAAGEPAASAGASDDAPRSPEGTPPTSVLPPKPDADGSVLASSRTAPAEEDDLDLLTIAQAAVAAAQKTGYSQLRLANAAEWARRWETADVEVDGDHEAQLALRFNIFQMLIAAPALSEHASIGAKTLSGFGYRHHVFWDTEIFMLPLFIYTQPDLARHMLKYRYHNLPGARAKAQGNGHEGAQFPWESAGDGREVTPTWVTHFADPTRLVRIWTGDIEIHITSDIAYSILQYWRVTGDDAWLRDFGAEIVLDGARFWASAARYEEDGKYHFRNVIGPDEYHDRIDDNAFTNHMVRWHLETAFQLLAWLRQHHPARHDELVAALDLSAGRLEHWRTVSEAIFLPAQTEAGVIEQFTGYFGLTDADLNVLRDPSRTLSMQAILDIDGCAQTQILKQPDVLMLQYLLPDRFSPEQVRANYDYYSPRTDHEYGSSLGPSVSAIMASRVGDAASAYEHFMRAARADLVDVRGNAGDGIHGASAGGLWQAAVFGFGGLRVYEDGWQTHPQLPAGWSRLAFKFYYRGELQSVEVT